MAELLSKSIKYRKFLQGVLFGIVVLCGAAGPALGQETIGGKFTLTENTRLGKKFLPAGAYTFSVEPAGMLQSVNSIQSRQQRVLVVVRSEKKPGASAIIFAMASRSTRTLDSSKLVLEPVHSELVAQSMYLDKQGLVLDFDWSSPKGKTQMLAQTAGPEPVPASRTTD